MARARNIKPAFFTNELLGTEDPMISLTFAGLWCLADKMGILEDRPLRIKAELFPYRDSLDVNGYLSVLARLGFIVRYENDGRRFIQVCNFRKHQSPHHTEKAKGFPFPSDPKSLIPSDNGYVTVTQPVNDGKHRVSERSDSLIPDSGFTDSLIPDSLQEPQTSLLDGSFDEFWKVYPNRKNKSKAEAAWKKIKMTPELYGEIMRSLAVQVRSHAWTKSNGEFVPHPTTWLNGKRWQDEVNYDKQDTGGCDSGLSLVDKVRERNRINAQREDAFQLDRDEGEFFTFDGEIVGADD